MKENADIIDVYHGSDHILEKPLYGIGRKDNDYGSGFYITRITVADVVENDYIYNKEYGYYEKR